MRAHRLTPFAAIGGSALTVAGAMTIMIVQGAPDTDAVAAKTMTTGVTVAPTAEATAVSVTRAVPAITGSAALPKEEQGLPGR